MRCLIVAMGVAASLATQHQFSDFNRTVLPAVAASTHAIVIVDVDGDGWAEIVCGNGGSAGEQNRIYRDDGLSGFVDGTSGRLPALLDATTSVAGGDVDGDGDPDLVFGNVGQNRLLVNDGAGRFVDAALPALADWTHDVELVDVDGDGDLDLLVANRGQNRLLDNDGTGRFSDLTATRLPAETADSRAIGVGDVDRDGDQDLMIANAGVPGAANFQYRNDGTGRFVDTSSNLPVSVRDSRDVVLADVNGDGSVDAIWANHGRNRMWLNNGRGRYQDATGFNLESVGSLTEAAFLTDVDGDGDRDLVLADRAGAELLLNNRGVFRTAGKLRLTAAPTTAIAFGDVDRDGDGDLAFAVDGGPELLAANLHRHLEGAPTALAGEGYGVVYHAMPGFHNGLQVVVPYASLGRSPVGFELPPLGHLFLDVRSLVIGLQVVIPRRGSQAIVYPVPEGMNGVTVHLQAAFLHGSDVRDWRFSNVQTVTVR